MRRTATFLAALALVACHRPDATPTPGPAPSSSSPIEKHAASHAGKRPPKPKSLAAVKPPRLPKLAEQKPEEASNAKSAPKKKPSLEDDYPCGTVWTGEDEVPIECDEPVDLSKYDPPAVPLVPFALLHASKETLPKTVDHRADGFEGRTLNQGKAPSCTAHSLAAIVDHDIALWTGKPGDVSVMEIWARYHAASTSLGVVSNMGKTLAPNDDWPYDAATAVSWLAKGKQCKSATCGKAVDEEKLKSLEKKGIVLVEEDEVIPTGDDFFDVIESKLAAGHDVGIGGKIPSPFKPIGEAGSKYVPDFQGPGKGGHAFATVGYTHVDDERYFLLKNSWGEKWGDGGYAWIHEATLKKILGGAHVVVIDPVGEVGLTHPRRKKGHVAACKSGEAPDSADLACKPTCDDGAPQHAGHCGVTEDCAAGFVNMLGECVLAAPKAKGKEPKSGVAFSCWPSGCIYTIPKGVEGCSEKECMKSCPAPDFRLGRGKAGLLCLE